jgi:hypothetical protein
MDLPIHLASPQELIFRALRKNALCRGYFGMLARARLLLPRLRKAKKVEKGPRRRWATMRTTSVSTEMHLPATHPFATMTFQRCSSTAFTSAVSSHLRSIWKAELEVTVRKPDISAASDAAIQGVFSPINAVFSLEDRSRASDNGVGNANDNAVDSDAIRVVVDEASGLLVSVSDFHKFIDYHFKHLGAKAKAVDENFSASATANSNSLICGARCALSKACFDRS